MKLTMFIKIPLVAGLLASGVQAVETPICEEFNGEENVSCVSTGDVAVIASWSNGTRTVEFYHHGKKAVFELSEDGGVYASTQSRRLAVASIPAEDTDRYIGEVLDGILDDIGWADAKREK